MNNEFPGNVFVARNYPPPMNTENNVSVQVGDTVTPTIDVTASDMVKTGDLIDSSAAAELLGITTNNLRQMVHKGRLTVAGREGRRNMFSRDSVNKLRDTRNK